MQPTEFEKTGIFIIFIGDEEPCHYSDWSELYDSWDGESRMFQCGLDMTHQNGRARYIWREDVKEKFAEIAREVKDEKANYPGYN